MENKGNDFQDQVKLHWLNNEYVNSVADKLTLKFHCSTILKLVARITSKTPQNATKSFPSKWLFFATKIEKNTFLILTFLYSNQIYVMLNK